MTRTKKVPTIEPPPPAETPHDALVRQVQALTDRVARMEVRPNSTSPDAIRAAVLAEFEGSSMRPLSASKDLRATSPDTFERVVNTAWANVARRLAGEA